MILDKIVATTKVRVEKAKKNRTLEMLKEEAEALACTKTFPFLKALQQDEFSFVCEIKKASPSKGEFVKEFPYQEIALDYEKAGAAALSVLTEPDWFQGRDHYLTDIVEKVKIPVLRKDFIIDAYQIYESKCIGASAILLICAILTQEKLEAFIKLAQQLGLSCLVEVHQEAEIEMALAAGAEIIGINNRNLKTFKVDVHTSFNLKRDIPKEVVVISESGIKTAEDIFYLENTGFSGALIGEAFMKSKDKVAKLEILREGIL